MANTQITAEPGEQSVIMTADFDAPRDLVFRAYVESELITQWLGPRRLTMTVERQEARDGGRWRFVNHDADGTEYGFHGVFHGAPSPELTIRTFEFEGAPGHVSLEELRLEERDGRSHVSPLAVYQSVEARRDGPERDGRRRQRGWERLEELLERLKAEGAARRICSGASPRSSRPTPARCASCGSWRPHPDGARSSCCSTSCAHSRAAGRDTRQAWRARAGRRTPPARLRRPAARACRRRPRTHR